MRKQTEQEHQPTWTELLNAARAGNNGALGQICQSLREYLLLVVAEDLNPGLRAKFSESDVVQQTMLEACVDLPAFRGKTQNEFRAWIKRLALHNLIDSSRAYTGTLRRDAAKECPIDAVAPCLLPADQQTASYLLSSREIDEQLQRGLNKLNNKQRLVIELRHRDGLDYRCIAAHLGTTEAAARKLWSRSVEILRRELSSQDVAR